jgi:uncharacterized integral membrane protein
VADRQIAEHPEGHLRKGGPKDRARLTTALALGAVVAIFAVVNLDKVEVNWIIASWSPPLIVVIVLCLALGGITGYVAGRRRS